MFGEFQISATERLLKRGGQNIPLPPKVFDLLLVLVTRPGQVVTKDELMNEVWPDTFVEETNIKVYVSTLRKALGENGDGAKFIETLPRRGYRFVSPVTQIAPVPVSVPELVIEKQTVSKIVIEEKKDVEASTELLQPALPATGLAVKRKFSSRTLLLGGTLLVLAAIGWRFWQHYETQTTPIRSLAVLPFTSLMQQQDNENLGLGLADSLITRLGATRMFTVRPTNAIQKFMAADRDSLEIGRQLKVEAVLDGHLQREGDQLRLTLQLLRTSDGATLWGESFDERFSNILSVQKKISENIAYRLTDKLSDENRQHLNKKYTENTAAFEAYIRGRFLYSKQDKDSLLKAIEFYRQATELDPNYALAWAGIADCYVLLNLTTVTMGVAPPPDSLIRARAAAEKAIELDESLAEGHVSMGAVIRTWLNNDDAAHREFERAIALNPNLAQAHNYYGMALMGEVRLPEALAELERARQLDPLSAPINSNVGIVLFRLRRYDEAIAQFQTTLRLDPNFVRAIQGLGQAYEQQKRYEEAIAEFQKAEKLTKGGIVPLAALGYLHARLGRKAEAQQILSRLIAMELQNEEAPYFVATVYVGLGETEQVYVWLDKIKHLRTVQMVRTDPRFDSLRDDPRMTQILSK